MTNQPTTDSLDSGYEPGENKSSVASKIGMIFDTPDGPFTIELECVEGRPVKAVEPLEAPPRTPRIPLPSPTPAPTMGNDFAGWVAVGVGLAVLWVLLSIVLSS